MVKTSMFAPAFWCPGKPADLAAEFVSVHPGPAGRQPARGPGPPARPTGLSRTCAGLLGLWVQDENTRRRTA